MSILPWNQCQKTQQQRVLQMIYNVTTVPKDDSDEGGLREKIDERSWQGSPARRKPVAEGPRGVLYRSPSVTAIAFGCA